MHLRSLIWLLALCQDVYVNISTSKIE